MLGEPTVAYSVMLVRRVLSTVDFNDEPLLATDEIDNVRPDWFLTNEFMAIRLRARN